MAFLTDEDYDSTIYTEILTAINRADPDAKLKAEEAAIEEITSYLSSRYDTTAIFAATGTNRNALIVMYTVDLAVYYMHSKSNPRMLPEVRKLRRDDAIGWLKQVSRAQINPNLPKLSNDTKDYVRFGSNTKFENYF